MNNAILQMPKVKRPRIYTRKRERVVLQPGSRWDPNEGIDLTDYTTAPQINMHAPRRGSEVVIIDSASHRRHGQHREGRGLPTVEQELAQFKAYHDKFTPEYKAKNPWDADKVRQSIIRSRNTVHTTYGKGIIDKLKKAAKIGLPIAAGVAGIAGAAYGLTRNKGAAPVSTYGKWGDSDYGPYSNQTGYGFVDKLKSAGKKALKYGLPIAVGVAGAAALHHATNKAPPGPTDNSRYSDASLPFADSDESSFRDRTRYDSGVKLTPSIIKSLLAMTALHNSYEPSAHHPWTSGGGLHDKIHHLRECKVCRGKGIGRKLWNGIKSAGNAVSPYVVPVGLAAASAGAAYYGLKHKDAIYKTVTEAPGRIAYPVGNYLEYNANPIHRPVQFDYDGKLLQQPVGYFGLGSLG
jgi:hypothetical protein